MKITRIVDLHSDAGWRVFSFLKIETDTGIVAGQNTTRATARRGSLASY
jgi:galactonate dehydratase